MPTMSPFGSESLSWNFGKTSPISRFRGPDFTALNSTCSFPAQGLYIYFSFYLVPLSPDVHMAQYEAPAQMSSVQRHLFRP